MKFLFLPTIMMLQSLVSTAQQPSTSDNNKLNTYVGFYNVRNFYAKVFIRDDSRLMISITEDPDAELIHVQGSEFHLKEDPAYKLFFHVNDQGECTSFNLQFPPHRNRSDLIGKKNNALAAHAYDTETKLTDSLVTPHFRLFFSKDDHQQASAMKQQLEEHYDNLMLDFKITDMPVVTVRLYPDMKTYHAAVHTTFAADWQAGQAWGKKEIRMTLENADSITSNGVVLHEFVHCIHMHVAPRKISPKWFWEGLAMYKGCCKFLEPKKLDYLMKGNYPTLSQINRDRTYQKNYELGYFLLEFIDHAWGWEKVLALMQDSGDIKKSLSISENEFEKRFYSFLKTKYLN